jgi:hypothetical protein
MKLTEGGQNQRQNEDQTLANALPNRASAVLTKPRLNIAFAARPARSPSRRRLGEYSKTHEV